MDALRDEFDFAKGLLKEHLHCLSADQCKKTVMEIVDRVLEGGNPGWAEFLLTDCYAKLNWDQYEQIIGKVTSTSEEQRKRIIRRIVDYLLREDLSAMKIPLMRFLLRDYPDDLEIDQRDQVIRRIVDVYCSSVHKTPFDAREWTEFLLIECSTDLIVGQRKQIIGKIVDCLLVESQFYWVFDYLLPLVKLLLKDCPADLSRDQRDQVIAKVVGYVLVASDAYLPWAEFLLASCYADLSEDQYKQIIGRIVDCVLVARSGYLHWAEFLLENCYADLSKDQRKQIIGRIVDYVLREDLSSTKIPLMRLLLKDCPVDLGVDQSKQVIRKIIDYVHKVSDRGSLSGDVWVEFLSMECVTYLTGDQRKQIIGLMLMMR
jgi:uncharacterized protein (DUF2164 family)